jgi:CBS domain-containing protein
MNEAKLNAEAEAARGAGSVFDASEQQLMGRRLDQVIRRAPATCARETPIREVLETLRRERIGSMLVTHPDGQPAGIFTLRDLLTRVALDERSIADPISTAMTPDPITLPADAFAVDGALAMARHGVHHIVLVEGGKVVGVVSQKDLFGVQRLGLAHISATIRQARQMSTLIEQATNIRGVARNLLAQGLNAEHLTRIISTLNDLLSQRIIELQLEAAGLDAADFCWISLGSEGRHEQTLSSDQDNGIIFADPSDRTPDSVREILLPVARKINEDLDACGFPLCRGDIMASNPRWCLSASEWRQAFREWIYHCDPEAVLNATIFFDFRPLYGQVSLAEDLRAWLKVVAADNRVFLRHLAESALINRPPLGIVREFVFSGKAGHPHTVDLKVNAATLFTDAARVFALAAGAVQTNTVERLVEWAVMLGISASEIEAWADAFHFLQLTRLRHQQAQIAGGEAPDNFINPDDLNRLNRRILKDTLRLAKDVQIRLALDFQL